MMNALSYWGAIALAVVVGLCVIGLIFARLYVRASAERAFVRTGLGGQKVIMSGGAVVLPYGPNSKSRQRVAPPRPIGRSRSR